MTFLASLLTEKEADLGPASPVPCLPEASASVYISSGTHLCLPPFFSHKTQFIFLYQ